MKNETIPWLKRKLSASIAWVFLLYCICPFLTSEVSTIVNFVLIIPWLLKNVLLSMKTSLNNMYSVLHVFRIYKNGIE